ncbi:MAG: inositol monophosphatase [Elusimicrobiaceae bacterium]|nr:inositol monophosphatase [Elusimicrobiaceae bacterium]
MPYISPLLTNVVDATKKAAQMLDRDFSELEKLQNSVGSIKTFVMNAYSKTEKNLQIELAKIRPDIPVFTPSSKVVGDSYFAVSPIEGLINFAHGNPEFAVSVALIEKGEIICAVIYAPAHDETFFAAAGKGAFKEGYRSHERLRVSAVKELQAALVASTSSFNKSALNLSKIHASLLSKTGGLRISGCVALDLAYLSGGKYDALISLDNHISSIAAVMLMLKEAGGAVREVAQKDIRSENVAEIFKTGNLVASNFNLNQKIFEIFK